MKREFVATVIIDTDALMLGEEEQLEAEAIFTKEATDAGTPVGEFRLIKICHRLNQGKAEYTFSVDINTPEPAKPTKATPTPVTPPPSEN